MCRDVWFPHRGRSSELPARDTYSESFRGLTSACESRIQGQSVSPARQQRPLTGVTPQGFPGVCRDSTQVLELFLLDQSYGDRVSSPALCSSLAFGISHACVLGAVVRWLRVQISFRCENAKQPGREEQSRCPLSASWGHRPLKAPLPPPEVPPAPCRSRSSGSSRLGWAPGNRPGEHRCQTGPRKAWPPSCALPGRLAPSQRVPRCHATHT